MTPEKWISVSDKIKQDAQKLQQEEIERSGDLESNDESMRPSKWQAEINEKILKEDHEIKKDNGLQMNIK